MLGDRAAALAALRTAVASSRSAALADRLAALRTAVLAHASMRRHSPARERARLDDTLRIGTSISLKMGPTALRSGLRRLPVLLTGFMQSCLIAAVGALTISQREAFVLLVVLDLPEPEVLALLRLTPQGFSGVKTRTFQAIDGYLGPRCGHLDINNPCKCPNRVQLALDQGFVQLPEHELPGEDYPTEVFTDLRRMFAALPPLRLAPATLAGLGA